MTLEQLSNELTQFMSKFESLSMRWVLSCKAYLNGRILSDLPHAFRLAYVYGSSSAGWMRINIQAMNNPREFQTDLLIKRINDSIPNYKYYTNKVRACREELLFKFGLDEELQWLFDLHKEQMGEFINLKLLLITLAQSMVRERTPFGDTVELISNWQLMCQSYPQLHEWLTQQEKNEIMLNLIRDAGIPCKQSTCHPTGLEVFTVPKEGQLGRKLIGCYFEYTSTKVIFNYLDQLCRAVRTYDDRIMLVVSVGEHSLPAILKSVKDPLFQYDVFINPQCVGEYRLDFSVLLRSELSAEISVTIFMVNYWQSPGKENVRWFD